MRLQNLFQNLFQNLYPNIFLASTLILLSCASHPMAQSVSTVEERGVASQPTDFSPPGPVSTQTKINCLPNRGPSAAFEFYDASTELDFSALSFFTTEPLRDHLLNETLSAKAVESTLKLTLTPAGVKYFKAIGSDLSFHAQSIVYVAGQTASRQYPTTAMILFPTDLVLRLHLEQVNTTQGRFDLAGSLSARDYEINLVCRILD